MDWLKGLIYFGIFCLASYNQAQSLDITLSSNACINERIDVTDNSVGISEIYWNFCNDDFDTSPSIEALVSLNDIGLNRGLELVEDGGNYYAFLTDFADGELYRLDFGVDPTNSSPSINLVAYTGTTLTSPEEIRVYQLGTDWYGFVGSASGTTGITRLDFGDSPANTPDAVSLGNFGYSTQMRDLHLIEEGGSYILLILDLSGERFISVDYGSSIVSIPTVDVSSAISGLSNTSGFDLVVISGEYYGFVTSLNGDALAKIHFGSSVLNDPTLLNSYNPSELTRPFRINIINNFGGFFAIVTDLTEVTAFFDLGDITSTSPTYLSYDLSNGNSYSGIFHNGSFHFYGLDGTSFERYTFNEPCGSSINSSELFNPDFSYDQAGVKNVGVWGYASDGTLFTTVESISVSSQTAPSISHTSQEVCISNPITFTPSNSSLSSYSWDFDGDGSYEIIDDNTGSDQSFDYSGLGTGTYTVRLDVNDGTCDNFYEEEITIYTAPPVPAFTVAANECVNTDISFTNDTDESQHTGVISYMWDFDNDGIIDSTDPNPTFAYSTSGTKTVVLYDTIPGCSNVSATFDIDISSGPTSDYTPSTFSACEGETISFTDNSTDAVDYFWDFQNGFTSSISNPPAQLYENSGSYFVSLTTTDAQGCEDTFVQEISISASPEISFDFDIPCTSPDGVQFFDLTTVDGADIVSWSWEVDGEEVSTQQNPTIDFSSTGVRTVGLTVQSSNGCEQYVTEDIEVLAAPSPDFSIDLGCQGEITAFTDETESVGNPIVSWLWTVDGVNYGTQDINHVFTNSGSFDVMLEVTGQNFCSETITKTVEIIELPQVGFTVNGECDNQVISAQDQSTGSADPVISRRWMLNGVNVGNGNQLLLSELEDNTYELELELETESGCLVSSSQTLEINEAPEAEFTSSRTYGIPGDRLTFTNNSSGGVSYQWLLDGELRSANPSAESIEFSTAGTYDVSLVAQNSLGCNDTTTREILIAIPEVDLAIGGFELIDEKTGEIYLEIQNFSNLPVEITEVQIMLANEFSVNEQINAFIGIGESFSKILSVKIPQAISKPSYFCVKLISQYEELEYSDLNPINNEKCLTLLPAVQVENPFPNPVLDQFRLKVVTPADGQVSLRLLNAAGKLHREETYQASAGLNNFFVDMSTLNPGIYFVTVDVFGNTFKRKVVKL